MVGRANDNTSTISKKWGTKAYVLLCVPGRGWCCPLWMDLPTSINIDQDNLDSVKLKTPTIIYPQGSPTSLWVLWSDTVSLRFLPILFRILSPPLPTTKTPGQCMPYTFSTVKWLISIIQCALLLCLLFISPYLVINFKRVKIHIPLCEMHSRAWQIRGLFSQYWSLSVIWWTTAHLTYLIPKEDPLTSSIWLHYLHVYTGNKSIRT